MKDIGVASKAWWHCTRGAGNQIALRVLLGLVFLVLQFETSSAFALSAACTAINSASTTSYSGNFTGSQFAAGESVTVSFTDSGANAGGAQPAADYVMVEPGFGNGEIYYSSSPNTGFNTYSTGAANLTSTGLFVHLKTGTYITGVTLTCTGGAAPVAGSVSANVAANSTSNPVTLAISGGTATSVAVNTQASHGTATASGTAITYTPTTGYSGTDSFTYTATNTNGTSTPGTVSITVTHPALTFSPAAGTLAGGTVGTAWSQNVSAAGGTSPYTYSATGLPPGLSITPAGAISGTPTTAGTYNATISATDVYDATGSVAYTIVIAGAAPVAGAVSATVAANSTNDTIALALSGGVANSVSVVSSPTHGTATASGTSITYTPTAGYSGSDSFTYNATNATGTSSTATVTITVSAPTLALTPAAGALANGTVGTAYSQTVSASGGTSPYIYAATGLPAGLIINTSTGTISGTPTASGNYTPTITATDSHGATGSASYTIAITVQAPVAGSVSATVAASSTNNAIALALSGGVANSVSVVSSPTHGTATASGTSITYTPTTGYSGSDSFTYNATNASGTSSTATVTITVSAPTLALTPATGALANGTVGTAYSQTVSAAGGTSPYSYAATGLPAGLSVNASNGTISGTPTTAGNYTPTITATDSHGAMGSANYTIAIAVQAPVAGPVSATVAANSTNDPIALALSGGAASSVSVISTPTHGTATASGTSITYTPTAGYSGSDSFTYNATNATGTSSTATVTITINAPTLTLTPAAGALANGAEGTAYSQTVSASGGTSPYIYAATGLPAGLIINTSTGTISGTPTASGSFTPTVTAKDAHGATGAATYALTIAPLPPVATPVTATVPANSTNNALRLVVSGGAATSVAIVNAARHGLATVAGTTITYTPNAGYSGTDSFTYSATNASGSSTATVNIAVTAPTLTVTPASGASLNATTGTGYTQTVSVAGGTSPYRFTASALPAGLSIDATTGTISGTPTATGTTTFTIVSTDANGVQVQARYTLTVSGVAPVAIDRSATLYAGQTTSVNLTDGASGGPFTGAAIVSAPSASQGVATVSVHGGVYTLTFAASAHASGAVLVRYTLTNEWGTSTPATVTLQVTARPDPSKDAEVIGLLNAQAQSAEQFANAQIGNFNDRLEQLHDERTRHDNAFNVQVGMPQSPAQQQGARAPASDVQAAPSASASASTSANASRQATQDANAPTLPRWIANDNLAVWTGGFVNFGTSDRDAVQLSHTLVGLSAGADYRFLPSFVAGLGFGYGRDVSDVGSSGTQSKGEAFSAAFYGSFHPGPVYVDGLLGYSHLDFDSRRYVSETGVFANGSRAGDQVFGALSSGYELRSGSVLVAPYARMQFSSTTLQHYAETGAGAFDLAYADQRLTTVSGVAGLRGEYAVPASWAAIKLRGRIEYSHALTGASTARLGYADTDDNSYAVSVLGLSENQLTTAVGIDFLLPYGLTTGLTYQGTFGMSDHTRNHTFLVRVSQRF
ncbi:putative Ig domain-containing protein [Paraburkholderia fungorum]|uniref:putative Ig domain-containing protein n=1 Tax=Paraburkholderia fungorum TaxID=134537 RepID=UPI0038B9A00D